MNSKLDESWLVDDLQVVSKRFFSQHPLRKDSGFWFGHCQEHANDEHACLASETVQQQDSAAGSNNRYKCREMLPAADLERWTGD